jgi:hypothetical protein
LRVTSDSVSAVVAGILWGCTQYVEMKVTMEAEEVIEWVWMAAGWL